MANKEAIARKKNNKLLEEAGWRFFPANGKSANIRLEAGTTIKQAELDVLGQDFGQSKKRFIDFLLLDANNFPLIVLEAKCLRYCRHDDHRLRLSGHSQSGVDATHFFPHGIHPDQGPGYAHARFPQ
ncbi:MAG: hypothetical protein FWF31_02220 [Desulfobulbus sp.]|nr:hypothetical protein [Desulfobulbus sp.]